MSDVSFDDVFSAAEPPSDRTDSPSRRAQRIRRRTRLGRLELTARPVLTPDEAQALLLGSMTDPFGPSWRPWVVRLALLQGLTVEEMARLRIEDVQQLGGRWWLRLYRSGDVARTPWRLREVPLTPALLAEHFIDFVRSAPALQGPLFPEMAHAKRPGDAMATWMRRWAKKHWRFNTPPPSLADLRSTFAQALVDTGCGGAVLSPALGLSPWRACWLKPKAGELTLPQVHARWLECIDRMRWPSVSKAMWDAQAAGEDDLLGLPM
jgi:integrase